jgi:hypothetical protein
VRNESGRIVGIHFMEKLQDFGVKCGATYSNY